MNKSAYGDSPTMEATLTESLRLIDHDIDAAKAARRGLDQRLARLREQRARIALQIKHPNFVPRDSLDQESVGNGFISPGSLIDQAHADDDGSQIVEEPDTSNPAIYMVDAESQLDAMRNRRRQVAQSRRAS